MPPKLKRARAGGAAAGESSTESDAPPAKRAKARQPAVAAPTASGRASALAAAAANASVLPPDADDALKEFQRACKQTKVSAELAVALRAQTPVLERLQSAAELLLEDEARDGGSLIDLSHRIEGKGSLLMPLVEVIDAFDELEENEDALTQAKRDELACARKSLCSALPHICTLIRSSYDTTIQRPDGKDALALLTILGIPVDTAVWLYRVTKALIDRGADVNTRFEGGRTPLIKWSFGTELVMDPRCAVGPLLLLQRGADIDARRDDGTTCAHAIAMNGNLPLAAALADAGWLAAADLTLLNNKGETALQIAQRKLAFRPDDVNRQIIHDLLRDHAALWTNKARPLVHRWLSHSLLIPDLTHVVLSFVDGKERGQLQ